MRKTKNRLFEISQLLSDEEFISKLDRNHKPTVEEFHKLLEEKSDIEKKLSNLDDERDPLDPWGNLKARSAYATKGSQWRPK